MVARRERGNGPGVGGMSDQIEEEAGMDELTRQLQRREFLKLAGAVGATVGLGAFLAACSSAGTTPAPATAGAATSGATAAPATAAASQAAAATPGPTG